MKPAIEIKSLSKKYRRGSSSSYLTLRDTISNIFRPTKNKLSHNEFWALKDVNLNIMPGEVVGIIGRNGAGKSTLLKVLSRITHPTSGEVILRGRVGSLLEVGTGFHQELTGRENIFLNGAVLGMTKSEITRKFAEIVAFAEIDKFLDTPVKHYSSGMYVRLAFAVAAHLQSDILLVDEVLAVGDAIFQKKCLGKMNEVAKSEGRTVLLVSHNREAIRQLCTSAILVDDGKIVITGHTDKVLQAYDEQIRQIEINQQTDISNEAYRRGNGSIRFTHLDVTGSHGKTKYIFEAGESIILSISYHVYKVLSGLKFFVGLRSGKTRELVTSAEHIISDTKLMPGTTGKMKIEINTSDLLPGEYPIYWHLSDLDSITRNIDVVDDLTPPIVIKTPGVKSETGYFKLPSRIISEKLEHRGIRKGKRVKR